VIQVSRKVMPSFFTVGNMFCGFMSVIFAMYRHDLVMASWMILLAAFLDTLDGKVARIANASSKFGVEYDSLADAISFGMAPSMLIYALFFAEWGTVGLFISFFPLLFATIRLARFNIQLEGFEKSEFIGLPSPAGAMALASYILFLDKFFPQEVFPKILLLLTLSVSVLMVSSIRYDVMPKFTYKGGIGNLIRFITVILVVVAAVIFPKTLLFPYILFYITLGFIRFLIRLGSGKAIKR